MSHGLTLKQFKKHWRMILFWGSMLFLFNSSCSAKETIIFEGKVIIDKSTSYKNVILDLTHGNFLIVNNASLEIENCIINGSISVANPFLIKVVQGYLSLKNNSFNISSINLPEDPPSPSIYDLINVTDGKINIVANHFTVDKSYTVGLLVTGTAHTAKFNITNNMINNFHGGILLRNTTEANIVDNIFKNVSLGNIYIINGYNSLIQGNVILFPGNNNVGDGIDVITSDKITLSHNYIFSGSCYSIIVLKSKNILLDSNRIMSGITYAISIMSSIGITDQYNIHLKHFLAKNSINMEANGNNQNITVINNYLAQNRYGLSVSNVDGLVVENNIFIQRFSNKESRKFWTDNKTLFHNVMHVNWIHNIYKEAFSQNEKNSNEKSLKLVEFPLFGGVDL